jgi:hypothetical protein
VIEKLLNVFLPTASSKRGTRVGTHAATMTMFISNLKGRVLVMMDEMGEKDS